MLLACGVLQGLPRLGAQEGKSYKDPTFLRHLSLLKRLFSFKALFIVV